MQTLQIESLSDSENFIGADAIMLHACFQILKDCVEHEKVDSHVDYESHKDFVNEVKFLYQWWMKRKEKENSLDNDAEDNEMLIRLIKIRTQLWT